jgi:superfamily I DNA/RNA helicase
VPRVPSDQWRPAGIEDLEPAGWTALRHPGSTAVVAGPGAGKTEFLAQRAAYLLQTGLCPPPRRILAISFKRDAAGNLSDRVHTRCSAEQAARFTSMTFDAFTKGLVDRFTKTIPATWRPTRPYDITFHNRRDYVQFIERVLREPKQPQWQAQIAEINPELFEPEHVGAWRLPPVRHKPTSGIEYAVVRWWQDHMPADGKNRLTFTLVNRLAELLVRQNPHIASGLRMTYPFVFLDEFQDATYAQYDFLQSTFQGSGAVLTAVGDGKQRIMGWAGARPDAFERIVTDFGARKVALLMNHRSSRDLVRIQHVVARALDAGSVEVISNKDCQVSGDVAQIWRFRDADDEAPQIARWIERDGRERNLQLRDFAVLVKQKADQYERRLSTSFADLGLGLRNEAKQVGKTTVQDLLADDLARAASAILRLGVQARARDAWQTAMDSLLRLRGARGRDDAEGRQVADELTRFIAMLRRRLAGETPDAELAKVLGEHILSFLDLDAARRAFPQYGTGDDLVIARDAFLLHFAAGAEDAATWNDAVDAFDGVGQVPLMTVHKSKGLEYDTVIFVGLDDDAWWSHSPGNMEGLATFFVALSRAKERAIFTYCEDRSRTKVRDLYELLARAGVPEVPL